MNAHTLVSARRPARLRARQKPAPFATGRDCSAPNPRPKRSAVRGCVASGCFARRRLPPTAMNQPGNDSIEMSAQESVNVQATNRSYQSKYALPLNRVTISRPRKRRGISAQCSGNGGNVVCLFRVESALQTVRVPDVSSNCPWRFRELELSSFLSSPRLENVREQSGACPANVHCLSERLEVVYQQPDFGPLGVCVVLKSCTEGARMFYRARLKYWLDGYSRRFHFASRVVFRASAKWRLNLSLRVVLSCVSGQVSGLMSSRAGRAHRDCLPLVTTPKQSLSFPSVAARYASRSLFALLNRSKIKND